MPSNADRVGSYAECAVCNRAKAPRGRSVGLAMQGSLCDYECDGYNAPPFPGDLWPGETAEEFGFPCQTTEERNAAPPTGAKE